MLLVKFSFAKSQIVLSLVLMMVFAAGIGPVQAGSTTQEPAQPPAPSTMAFDGALVNEYMDECQSVGAGDCLNYAFTLAGADNVAATGVQSEQFVLSANDADRLSGAFNGAMVNEYMAECRSVGVGDCLNYAFTLAGADNVAATGVQLEQFGLSVNDADRLSGTFDGAMVNEYMAECQSVTKVSVVECLDYAFGFAAPDGD